MVNTDSPLQGRESAGVYPGPFLKVSDFAVYGFL